MKKILTMILVISLIFGLTACGSGTQDSSADNGNSDVEKSEPIYIGVLDAFTGDRAMSGMYAKEGAEMFLEEINSKGGVLGREVVIIYEDDQGNETAGTNAYQKITSQYDLSATVLCKYSSVVLAIEPFVKEAEIPAICTGSSVNIANSDNDWLFSVRKSDYDSGKTIAKAAHEKLNMTKVAIIHSPDALGTGITPVIQEALDEYGVEVVSIQQFSPNEKNFAPYIAKVIDSGCDGLIGIAQQTEAALIMTSVRDAGLDIPCIGNSAFGQQTAIQNAGTACNGWYSVAAWSPTIFTEPAKSWIAEYTARYGHEPDMSSALTYDALAIICKAIEICGSDDPADVKEAIKQIKDFEGLGSTYSFIEGTRMMATSEYLTHIEDQKSIIVDTIFN